VLIANRGEIAVRMRFFSRGVTPRIKDIPPLRDPIELDRGTADDRVSDGSARS